ncbi:MAG: hypothetical protein R6V60_04320 [Desulfobacterales bacterium]
MCVHGDGEVRVGLGLVGSVVARAVDQRIEFLGRQHCLDRSGRRHVQPLASERNPARNYKEIIQMRDDYEKAIQSVLEEGLAEGIFAVSDMKVISYGILSMCTSVCTWFNKSGRLSKEEVADIYSAFILKALAKS